MAKCQKWRHISHPPWKHFSKNELNVENSFISSWSTLEIIIAIIHKRWRSCSATWSYKEIQHTTWKYKHFSNLVSSKSVALQKQTGTVSAEQKVAMLGWNDLHCVCDKNSLLGESAKLCFSQDVLGPWKGKKMEKAAKIGCVEFNIFPRWFLHTHNTCCNIFILKLKTTYLEYLMWFFKMNLWIKIRASKKQAGVQIRNKGKQFPDAAT